MIEMYSVCNIQHFANVNTPVVMRVVSHMQSYGLDEG